MATLPTIKTYKQESVKKVYEAIEYNKTAFDKREDFIYVLDTNALLKIFALDKTSFIQLKSLFEQNRFYATHQIETEFLRNRENVSKQYYFYNRKRFVEKYKDLNSSIQQFINDFTFVIAGNEILKNKLLSLKKIANEVSDSVEDFNSHLLDEKADVDYMNYFKMIVDNIDFSTTLDDKEYDNLKKEFEELFKKSKNKNNKESLPDFPGRGEKKQINEYGDYLIFHELLKLSKDKKKSVVLLTNDVAKDDWVDKNGNTFESYQIMFYSVTGHSFKVEKYDDFQKEKAKINPEVIVSDFPDYILDERNGRLIPKYQFGAINGEYMEYQRFNDSERLIHDLLLKLYRD